MNSTLNLFNVLGGLLNFRGLAIMGVQSEEQDRGDFSVSSDGLTLLQDSQSWEQIQGRFEVTSETRLQFEFSAQTEGEIHGIMFANGNELSQATTIQVFGTQEYGVQAYKDYEAGSGVRSYDIALGEHFTGTFDRMIFLTDDDAGAGADSSWSDLRLTGAATGTSALNFRGLAIMGVQPEEQDRGDFSVSSDGLTLLQDSQSWEQIQGRFEVTSETRLQFEFSAQTEGEIHGIMFANGNELSQATTIQVFGTQEYGVQAYKDYEAGSGVRSYDIALGEHFTGTFDRMIFLTDDDAGAGADSSWSDLRLTGAATGTSALNFRGLAIMGVQPEEQDRGDFSVSSDGLTLLQDSQSWEQIQGRFEVTSETRLQFEFSAQTEGEIHGIMFANGNELSQATTIQVFGTQEYGVQAYKDYEAGSGVRSYDIALGEHFTGTFDRMIFLTDDDAGAGADSSWSDLRLTGAATGTSALNFRGLAIMGVQPEEQDRGDFSVSSDGLTLLQDSQSWEQIQGRFEVTSETRLQFEFSAQTEGEIHGIMFANGNELSQATTIQVFGTQEYGVQAYKDYEAGSGVRSYDIALGEHFTGTFDRMIFLTDDDAGAGADSSWSDLRLTGAATGTSAPPDDPEPSEPTSPPESSEQPSSSPESPEFSGTPLSEIVSGRVSTLVPEGEDIAQVRVLTWPSHGNLTVNPDNTLALVLTETDYVGQMRIEYEVTDTSGNRDVVSVTLDVQKGPIENGWGLGNFYMLETNERDEVLVEWGDNHREVYVSGDEDALTRADIAALEGLDVEQITGLWLRDHPEYGASENMALADDAGRLLWRVLMEDSSKVSASHWLRLEAGYEYDMNRVLYSGMRGESELHPIHITSYGEGEKPVLTEFMYIAAEGAKNLVFSNVELGSGVTFNPTTNLLFDNITSSSSSGKTIVLQRVDGFTLRNSEIYDVRHETPVDGVYWDEADNRISGIFAARSEGILVENSFFDHNGWADGYTRDLSTSPVQPPSIFSHNVYFGSDLTDVTFRDSISMRGSSFGAQFRSGAFIEDNVFLDNNGAVFVAGGLIAGLYAGNYSLYSGNVVTSGAYVEYGGLNGQLAGGIGDYAPLTTLVDNIVTHLADPDNTAEQIEKDGNIHPGLIGASEAYYNDTVIYNWRGPTTRGGSADANTDGLDIGILDRTTIQRFAADLLGDPGATIEDLAVYLRASAEGAFEGVSDPHLIVDFFRAGFGLEADLRTSAQTLRFVPDDLGDGVRWDNRLNWSTKDLPGTVAGDGVDLAGNWVHFGGNADVRNLDFGDGGRLSVKNGRLDVTGEMTADGDESILTVTGSGQIWVNSYADQDLMNILVDSGRLAVTGNVDGRVALDITDGQVLLATPGARFDLVAGSRITIVGDGAEVGFDGATGGTALLRLEEGSTLRYEAAQGTLGTIGEFRSGRFGEGGPNVTSGINLGEARLEVDLTDIADAAATVSLMSADELIGAFSEIDVRGLSGTRDARLVFDYDRDEIVLHLSAEAAGSGELDLTVLGTLDIVQSGTTLMEALTSGQPILPGDVIPNEVMLNGELLTDFL